jgi:outer membrane lipoprotein SlyB
MLYTLLLIVSIAAVNANISMNAARSDAMLSPRPLSFEQQQTERSPATAKPLGATRGEDRECDACGIVEAINEVQVKLKGVSLGGVAGGVAGALFGNEFGGERTNTAATIAGGVGGAHIGGEIDSNIRKMVRYWVRVRLNDGSPYIANQFGTPVFEIGDLVRIVNGEIIPAT